MALHIFNTPNTHQIQECIDEGSPADAILLVEKAATQILCSDWKPAVTSTAPRVFVLTSSNLSASKNLESDTLEQKSASGIDFPAFVELTTKYNPIISW